MRLRSVPMAVAMAMALTGGVLVTVTATSADTIGPGTAEAPRDILITMTNDLRFDPADIVVMTGETVRFVLDNPTAVIHDFTLGDLEAQELHAVEMAAGTMHHEMGHDDAEADMGAMPDEMGHDDAEADMGAVDGLPAPVTVPPGETVTVLATFTEPGDLLIGCHQPGHWEAGMKATVTVVTMDA